MKIEEKVTPRGMGNTLHVEESIADARALFLCICATEEDPSEADGVIYLTRAQTIALRDEINRLLSERAAEPQGESREG